MFDGYSKVGLKTAEHARRYKSQALDVIIYENSAVTATQELFLANSVNKSLLIEFLCTKFNEGGMKTSVADGDADVLIVSTAIKAAEEKKSKIVLVGEDTDLIMFAHAFTGCDSTSRIFGKGKVRIWTLLLQLTPTERAQIFSTVSCHRMLPRILFVSLLAKCFFTFMEHPKKRNH